MNLDVRLSVTISPGEAGFLTSMLRNPQFWGISINNAMRGTPAVRKSLRERGLVAVRRIPATPTSESREVAELTELGRAVAEAAAARVASIEV